MCGDLEEIMRKHLSKFFMALSMTFMTEGQRKAMLEGMARESEGWTNLNKEWDKLNEECKKVKEVQTKLRTDQERVIEMMKTVEAVAAEKNIDLTRPTMH